MAKTPHRRPEWLDNPALREILDEITPADSAMTADEYLSDESILRLRTPDVAVGDRAPDFTLPVFDYSSGSRIETGMNFHLQEVAATSPVALIFGSYT